MKWAAAIFLLLFVLSHHPLKSQEIMHYWHFNSASGALDTVYSDFHLGQEPSCIVYRQIDPDGPPIGIMDDVSGSEINARLDFDAGRGIRPRNPSINGELYISLNSEGYDNLQLSYATERSGSGMLKQVLYYTTDGENFTPFGDTVEVNTDYEFVNFDFTDFAGVADNEDFAVVIRFLEQNTADNGNNRFDNIVLEGVPLEESPDLIHYWHFNEADGELDTVYADYFNGLNPSFLLYRKIDEAGDDIGIMDDVSGTALNARGGYEAGRGIRPRNPSANGELFISLDSRGYEDLQLSYATERSGQGMLKQVLYYTNDGQNFTPFGDTIDIETSYRLATFDFSGLPEVNDEEHFAVVIRFLEQNTADNGNNRFDNIVLEGTPIGNPVEGVAINEGDVAIPVGTTFTYTATVLPPGAANQEVSWRSENESVATIDQSGNVTGISGGFSQIIVTTDQGGYEDTVTVEVLDYLNIQVEVSDGDGPLDEVEVTLDNETDFTDQVGRASFERLPGEYHLIANKAGYIPFNQKVQVNSDTLLEISLKDFPPTLFHYWHFNGIPVGTIEEVEADYSLTQGAKPIIYYEFLPDYVEDPDMTKGYMDDYINGSILNVQMNQPAGAALRVRNRSEGRALVIELPTTGAENIVLTFDVHRSGQGMLVNHFEYTLNGTDFSNEGIAPKQISVTEDYVTHTIDFTEVDGANDNEFFALRIVYEGNTNQGNGNNRYDNIAMFADAVTPVEETEEETVRIFPNPSTGIFHLEGNAAFADAESQFHLFNVSGQLVRSGTIDPATEKLDFSGLETGTYHLLMQSGERFFQKKVVIAR